MQNRKNTIVDCMNYQDLVDLNISFVASGCFAISYLFNVTYKKRDDSDQGTPSIKWFCARNCCKTPEDFNFGHSG